MAHDIFTAILVWLVPIIGVYVISLIPKVREKISEKPLAAAIVISWLLTAATVLGYDQFVLIGGKHPDAKSSCPLGQVVVGLNFNVDSGGPHGIVSAVSPVCQPISLFR
jgi:hypothetical protein